MPPEHPHSACEMVMDGWSICEPRGFADGGEGVSTALIYVRRPWQDEPKEKTVITGLL